MPPEPAVAVATGALASGIAEAHARFGGPLRVADVAIFYGERSGGIRTYLEAKAAFAARTRALEHHLVVPGREGSGDGNRHEQRSLRLAASNGYRVPLGGAGLHATLRMLRPEVVLLHDPFWTPRHASRIAHELGAVVVAVHHSSAALHAAGLPGPHAVYARALRRWIRRAYGEVDAVMSVVETDVDARRPATLQLRLGLDPAFNPRPEVERGDHVLYVGRMSREKGLRELLEAAAASREPWRLVLLGTGPIGDTLRERARQLGLGKRVRFHAYLNDRDDLARAYAAARCVVLPGAHETFGLAALEAAACGAAVVTAATTPSAHLLGGFVETFQAGDPSDLLRAIEAARHRERDLAAAQALAARHDWDTLLTAELADMRRLVGRS
ncbi:MAG TPA: glycosyltransferase [Solirubrobacteraceae bacterium]|nr:glycosyltransferase [Solirubrobacteraceae bacterium]